MELSANSPDLHLIESYCAILGNSVEAKILGQQLDSS